MFRFIRVVALVIAAVFGLAPRPAVAAIVDAEASGKAVSGRIEVAGGISADLTIAFEDAVNLSAEALGLSAELVNPLDVGIAGRLPSGLVSVPPAFAVLLKVEPVAASGFSFDGVATVDLYTSDLTYVAGSPLRLFKSHAGGPFVDVTEMIAGGSYRTRGGGGNFSDFLIVADTRPLQQTIDGKFDAVSSLLSRHSTSLGFARRTTLGNALTAARNAWLTGDYAGAIESIDGFEDLVRNDADAGAIPNRWSAAGGATNIAGELRAAARTLRFSLTLADNNL